MQQMFNTIMQEAPLDQRIRLATMVRTAYVNEVAATREVLDPKRLRALDENIAKLKRGEH